MRKQYIVGLMLEEIYEWMPGESKTYYRVYSGKMHGPVCPTRREALWQWFINRFFLR